MSYADIPTKRIEAHSRICASATLLLLRQIICENKAADRCLSTFLRQNHQFGSRDRRIISETLFSLLRWWGWLKYLLPENWETATEEEGNSLPKADEFYACFAAAWLLEGRQELPPSASWWLHKSGVTGPDIPVLPPAADLASRRKCLRAFFPEEMPALTLERLLPEWSLPLIECPEDIKKLIGWLQQRPPLWLRAQTNDIDRIVGEFTRNDVKLTRHNLMPHALHTNFAGVNIKQTEAFLAGKIEVQDIASQAVALVAAPQPGQHWWDCCAGAGGKTLHLAWLMKGKGRVLASDKRGFKLEELRTRARRCNLSNIYCKEWLGIEVKSYANLFHGVLVDVPCSCSGTWRRNPDLRWTTDGNSIAERAQLQRQLLENASKAVAPGGTLVYSTCSMFRQENQDVVLAFIAEHPDFSLQPFASPITGEETDGMMMTWPWHADCDAMFVAKLTKTHA